ncbi:MAG: ATP synthase F1 subunit epsilon [Bacteroidota bacterium]|nr:ATP synthase F1 subunit epsilon [Bacteroidota bacterium]MDP3145512.1 ATP synthase F1 subunit epsilon [Bacteroidota bacterium]MDP3556472.1 ATP synthase F1 subunit epsilon [Bacteroidota bacterium]
MKIEIITPDKKLYEGSIKSAIFPGSEGSFGILNDHAPLIGTLKAGKVELIDENNTKIDFEILGGVVEVLKNKVIVLAG